MEIFPVALVITTSLHTQLFISIFRRRASIFFAEKLKEETGVFISNGQTDIVGGEVCVPQKLCRLGQTLVLNQFLIS